MKIHTFCLLTLLICGLTNHPKQVKSFVLNVAQTIRFRQTMDHTYLTSHSSLIYSTLPPPRRSSSVTSIDSSQRSTTLGSQSRRESTLTYSSPCHSRCVQSTTTTLSSSASSDQWIAWTSMATLAAQFGAMPTLQKKFVPKKLCRSSMVFAQEICKFLLSTTCFLVLLSSTQRQDCLTGWTISAWWELAGFPAALYALQNYAKLLAYPHLAPVTYSVLNQTKTISTAICCYWLLGIRQSALQMVALSLLLLASLIIEHIIPLPGAAGAKSALRRNGRPRGNGLATLRLPVAGRRRRWIGLVDWKARMLLLGSSDRQQRQKSSPTTSTHTLQPESSSSSSSNLPAGASCFAPLTAATSTTSTATTATIPSTDPKALHSSRSHHHFTKGVLPLLFANLTSGLAGALGQGALQRHHRNVYLYGMELSSASSLLVVGSVLLLPSVAAADRRQLRQEGWRQHWTRQTWIPIGAHAVGGLLVGLVTQYAGSVQKGFSLIAGVLLSGLIQHQWLAQEPLTREQVVGAILACLSMWMHSSFPPSHVY